MKSSIQYPTIDRVGVVICFCIKVSLNSKDQLDKRYMINLVDNKSRYCRVIIACTKDATAKRFEQFLTFLEKLSECARFYMNSGGEKQIVDLFCKNFDVARQSSKTDNQSRKRNLRGCIGPS